MSRLGIFGTSGHAREVRDIALAVGYAVTFIARDHSSAGPAVQGGALILEEDVEQMGDAVFAIAVQWPENSSAFLETYNGLPSPSPPSWSPRPRHHWDPSHHSSTAGDEFFLM